MRADRIGGVEPPQDGIDIADDDRQQIVEIMGDAAGQMPTASIFCAWRSASSRLLALGDLGLDPCLERVVEIAQRGFERLRR
jgi:hypothetical protein